MEVLKTIHGGPIELSLKTTYAVHIRVLSPKGKFIYLRQIQKVCDGIKTKAWGL